MRCAVGSAVNPSHAVEPGVALSRTSVHQAFAIVIAALTACGLGRAGGEYYEFTLDPAASALSAQFGLTFQTNGTLIGNWDAKTNPKGTRTKPGLFGPFGPTENEPVAVQIAAGVSGSPQSANTGGFSLSLNPPGGSLQLSDYSANLLAAGPVSLGAELSLLYETFRTRNPDSLYIAVPGVPFVLPIGEATLTELTAVQTSGVAGLLTPSGPDLYDFAVAIPVSLSGRVNVLGSEFELPGLPAVLPLTGQISLKDDTARLVSQQAFDLGNSVPIGQKLPQLPLDLPTILPPGGTAHLLLNLVLEQIDVDFAGQLTTTANGVLIPEPGAAALLWLFPVALRLRTRARR
ncbi:MAG: hypothetical protein LC135_06675 [Phycisphaerae bacterium]|nr:hypothetical protein [Phycisphaerae bacterium]MCZ2399539.1 hypothetical protein [Phycisphaerae bacterium]